MSPTRRSLIQAMVGAGVVAALPAQAEAARPRSDFEEMVAVRDTLRALRDRAGRESFAGETAQCAARILDMTIMTLCPHGRESWIAGRRDSIQTKYRWYFCPQCRTWGNYRA